MSELIQKLNDATTRLADLQKQREDAEKSAQAHEAQARADRRTMSDVKTEMAQLNAVITNARVALQVQTDQQAAASARNEAEQALARAKEVEGNAKAKQDALDKAHEEVAAKKAELDALLAQSKAVATGA